MQAESEVAQPSDAVSDSLLQVSAACPRLGSVGCDSWNLRRQLVFLCEVFTMPIPICLQAGPDSHGELAGAGASPEMAPAAAATQQSGSGEPAQRAQADEQMELLASLRQQLLQQVQQLPIATPAAAVAVEPADPTATVAAAGAARAAAAATLAGQLQQLEAAGAEAEEAVAGQAAEAAPWGTSADIELARGAEPTFQVQLIGIETACQAVGPGLCATMLHAEIIRAGWEAGSQSKTHGLGGGVGAGWGLLKPAKRRHQPCAQRPSPATHHSALITVSHRRIWPGLDRLYMPKRSWAGSHIRACCSGAAGRQLGSHPCAGGSLRPASATCLFPSAPWEQRQALVCDQRKRLQALRT